MIFCRPQPQETSSLDFGIDSLEQRRMMAGDVHVQLRGDHLIVTGDAEGNAVNIGLDSHGNVEVRATPNYGTTVHGGSTGMINGSINKISVRSKGGDDIVRLINCLDVRGGVNIQTSSGDDFVEMDCVLVGDDVKLSLGSGNDQAQIEDMSLDTFSLNAGSGNDDLELESLTIRQGVRWNLASGNDELYVRYSEVSGTSRIRTGSGDDAVRLQADRFVSYVDLRTGSGDDSLHFQPPFFGDAEVEFRQGAKLNLGSGDDSLDLEDNPRVLDSASISGGSGADYVNITQGAYNADNNVDNLDLEDFDRFLFAQPA